MEIVVDGVDSLKRRMASLQRQLAGPSMAVAVRAGGEVIRDAMISAAPILDERTAHSTALAPGALKADIKVRMSKREAEKQGEPVAVIGPGKKTARVARWVEYGHRLVKGGQLKILANGRTKGRGKLVGEVVEHPFLRPAFEASVGEAQAVVKETMKREIALWER
jgi:HK97 gp10 family phage protein